MINKRTTKILDFLKEIEKMKLILRVGYLSDGKTREDDAQHSYHLAMMVMLFGKELSTDFDVNKAIKLALIHDLGEIYVGDGWYPTEEERSQKSIDEEKAIKKVFALLPDDLAVEYFDLWREYEDETTIEAKIVKGFDKICYVLQYSIAQKIEYDKMVSVDDSRAYATPKLKFDPKLVEIYESLLAEMPHHHDPDQT